MSTSHKTARFARIYEFAMDRLPELLGRSNARRGRPVRNLDRTGKPRSAEVRFRGIAEVDRRALLVDRDAIDPTVWSGRAVQEVSSAWLMRSCITVSGL